MARTVINTYAKHDTSLRFLIHLCIDDRAIHTENLKCILTFSMSLQDERVSIVEEMMVMAKRTCAFVRIDSIIAASIQSEANVKRMVMVVL